MEVSGRGNWVARARRQRDGGDAPLSESEQAELDRLRKEIIELRMLRDVLKDASKDRPGQVADDVCA